jgi:ribonuclease HII
VQESPSITIESNYLSHHSNISGTDEVGRGPLAGPVVAATVMASGTLDSSEFTQLLEHLRAIGVTDSKRLSAKRRKTILEQMQLTPETVKVGQNMTLLRESNFQLDYAVAEIPPLIIDKINILNAALTAMSHSYNLCWQAKQEMQPMSNQMAILLVDGQYPPPDIPPTTKIYPIIGGDHKSTLIALASIIAKEYRDHLMSEMDRLYPGYGFSKHAGYPTKAHKEALARLGALPIHRRSFKGVAPFVTK